MNDGNSAAETWLPVVGYDGYYEVSDFGNVRSVTRWVTYITGQRVLYRGKPLAQAIHTRDGHKSVSLWKHNIGRPECVHRLMMQAFVGPPPAGQEVCHNDGDPQNNVLSNLRYDTRLANRLDSTAHGTNPNRNKTHCPRRHLLVEPNLVPGPWSRGSRTCRACGRATTRIRKRRLKGWPTPSFQELSDQIYAEIMAGQAVS